MKTAFWAAALGAAVLWPARLAGPLDGAPLDSALEAIVLGLALPAAIWLQPALLRSTVVRALVVVLLAWKAITAAALTQDGWCIRFTTPVPVFVDDTRVPHSWDARADWRAPVPQCSAVMARGYTIIERFPAWFYNLPPANWEEAGRPEERPPFVTIRLDLAGALHVAQPGVLKMAIADGSKLRTTIDGAAAGDIVSGVPIPAGTHQVEIEGELTGSHWVLVPSWNDQPMWSSAIATMRPPSSVDRAVRPWGRWLPPLIVSAILGAALASVARSAGLVVLAPVAAALVVMAAAVSGRASLMRLTPLVLLYAVLMPWPRRLQNIHGMVLMIGVPFLALFAVMGAPQAGLFTWYSSGDDWWQFQRYAYRIYLQGYWLEGGEPTFWFQPFYRWIAGALHMIFGDSSVGELFWDAGGALICAAFAFQITRVVAGFRWGLGAAVTTLALLLLGPAWYLFGRGLSEISAAGFLYAAALFAMRGRHGNIPALAAAGLLAVLAFYTRLNNLPMVVTLLALAWSPRLPVESIFRPAELRRTISTPVFAMLLAAIVLGVAFFMGRTYYYTGVFSLFEGTQARHLSVWQVPDGGGTIAGNVIGSVLMVLTMTDPPRADPRAIPIVIGVLSAIAGVLRLGPFGRLPMAAVALCLAGMAGALVARGSAYPGRFSLHILPAAVALATLTVALLARRRSPRVTP